MNILVTTGIFPPDVGGPAKFVPLIADKLSEKNNLKVITLSEKMLSIDKMIMKYLGLLGIKTKFLDLLKHLF